MKEECKTCRGAGEIVIGENLVSLDMAIDAGDRNLEGSHHSWAYGQCPDCEGSGFISIKK